MTIQASCGHVLAGDEGPEGLGWTLSVKDFDRQGRAAVRYGSYCGRCRAEALKEPGYVLQDARAEMSWLTPDAPSQAC